MTTQDDHERGLKAAAHNPTNTLSERAHAAAKVDGVAPLPEQDADWEPPAHLQAEIAAERPVLEAEKRHDAALKAAAHNLNNSEEARVAAAKEAGVKALADNGTFVDPVN